MTQLLKSPLSGPPPTEIPLNRPPLESVLGQIRFSTVLRLTSQAELIPFQEAIRGRYPLFSPEQGANVHIDIGPSGPVARQEQSTVWRFLSSERDWRVSLGSDWVALETKRYTSRDDFLARLTEIVQHIETIYRPNLVTRIGLRYIDRLTGPELDRANDLIAAPFFGVSGTELSLGLKHSITETSLETEEGGMVLRWGRLPPNGTVDPALLASINEPSWVLDIDAFREAQDEFRCDPLAKSFRLLAERAYSVFRFVVTPDFLKTFGAQG